MAPKACSDHWGQETPGERTVESECQKLPTLNLTKLEQLAIWQALQKGGGSRTYASKQLGISIRTLQRKLKGYAEQGESPPPPLPDVCSQCGRRF